MPVAHQEVNSDTRRTKKKTVAPGGGEGLKLISGRSEFVLMLRNFYNTIRERRLRKKYCTGSELSQFIARDVRRDIQVLDDSGIGDGYVVARVRTTNVLYVIRNLEPAPEFGPPEILHLDRVWKWGGESWGGTEPKRATIPLLTPNDLRSVLSESFPQSEISTEQVNPDHGSWRLRMTVDHKTLEYVWGPLSGFGGIDSNRENSNIFAYCDEYLHSVDDAIRFAESRLTTAE